MRIFSFFFFSLFVFQIANAQLSKVIHQTFEIDSIDNLTINLVGEYELVKWAGNTILTETKVEIYNTTVGIFKFFIEEKKRYEIVADLNGANGTLFSFDSKRPTIKNNKTGEESYEMIKVKIFVPDDFNLEDPVNLVRMTEPETSNNN